MKYQNCQIFDFKVLNLCLHDVYLHTSLDETGVDSCNTVDSMSTYDGEMSHVDTLMITLLNDGHPAHAVKVTRVTLADFLNVVYVYKKIGLQGCHSFRNLNVFLFTHFTMNAIVNIKQLRIEHP